MEMREWSIQRNDHQDVRGPLVFRSREKHSVDVFMTLWIISKSVDKVFEWAEIWISRHVVMLVRWFERTKLFQRPSCWEVYVCLLEITFARKYVAVRLFETWKVWYVDNATCRRLHTLFRHCGCCEIGEMLVFIPSIIQAAYAEIMYCVRSSRRFKVQKGMMNTEYRKNHATLLL